MYTGQQIEALFSMIGELRDSASNEGCEPELMVVDSTKFHEVLAEVKRLKALEQCLMLGRHEHKHGDSLYLFLVPKDVQFGEDEFEANLQEDFDPADDESLSVDSMDEPQVIGEAIVDPLAGNPKLEVLEDLGYDIDTDSDQPGMWIWTAPTDGCESSFHSAVEALDAAWLDASDQAKTRFDIHTDEWAALSFDEQAFNIRKLAAD